MRQIFMDVATLTKEKGDALEQEMSFVFETPEKHTWREGYDVIWTFFSKNFDSYYIYSMIGISEGNFKDKIWNFKFWVYILKGDSQKRIALLTIPF